MPILQLKDLPAPPAGRTGWPWTEEPVKPKFAPESYPRISIVTPTYGQGAFIEETIRSVLLQGYPNLDYQVIDGGSKDETLEILQKYSPFLTRYVSEKDAGQCDAINKGLAVADGEIFNWLNSDDFYYPDTLFKVAHLFMENPETTCVGGRSRVFIGDKTKHIYRGVTVKENWVRSIAKLDIGQPETFFRMNAVKQMGPLQLNLHFAMDVEWWMKYLLLFGQDHVKKVDDIFVNFRYHENSKSGSQAPKFFFDRAAMFRSIALDLGFQDFARAVEPLANEKIKDSYKFNHPFPKEVFAQILPELWLYFGNVYYEIYDYRRAAACFKQCDWQKLLPEDQVLFKNLNFRSRFIPPFVIKTLKKLRK